MVVPGTAVAWVVLGTAVAVPETAVVGEGHLGTVVEEADLGIVVVADPETVATVAAAVVVDLTQLLLRRG